MEGKRFQCPGVGPSVCDKLQLIWEPTRKQVSMPRCGAFGVRPVAPGAARRVRRVSMPRCGAFGVRLSTGFTGTVGYECFNAPVWGLRCATSGGCGVISRRSHVSMPRCGAFGVRHRPRQADGLGQTFQCPGVGPSVCDYRKVNLTGPVELRVSMPRCGAFGVRRAASAATSATRRCFNAPVWGLRCATGSTRPKPSVSACFNAPVWGLRCATPVAGRMVAMPPRCFNAPVWGLRCATVKSVDSGHFCPWFAEQRGGNRCRPPRFRAVR